MNIYIDGSKRAAVSRMFPVWNLMGHKVVDDPLKANVQLSVVSIKHKGLPTVLRLDGIYYDKSENYQKKNSPISISHKQANAVVYQSLLSKKMCEKFLSVRDTKIFDVIHNGIESWSDFKNHEGINIVSCSKWRRHKRLPEIIEIFNMFHKQYPNSKLHIIGPMKKGSVKIDNPSTIYYDEINEQQMKEIYRICDIYIHLSKKDSCPSSVVESISAGIPIVTTDACGGATEMANLSKNCFVIKGDDCSLEADYIYQDKYNQVSNPVKSEIINAMDNIILNNLRTELPEQLTIEYVAKKYIQIMERII